MRATMLVGLAAVVAVVSWSVCVLGAVDYVQIDAQQLVRSPQSAWARPILFTDELAAPLGGADKKLDRKKYAELLLKAVGSVWVPEEDLKSFAGLEVGKTYSFGGTVDSVRGKYYVIVDMSFPIQTKTALEKQWSGMMEEGTAGGDDPVVQNLLVTAQNRLIRLAQEQGVTVAQLVEAQTDGGQRIAEKIVAESLQSQLRASNQTAEQVMIEAVVALLQKEAARKGGIPADERLPKADMPDGDESDEGALAVLPGADVGPDDQRGNNSQEDATARTPVSAPEAAPDEPVVPDVAIPTDDVAVAKTVAADVEASDVDQGGKGKRPGGSTGKGLSDLVVW